MFQLITGLYRAMEQGAVLAHIAERHANDPAAMADAIRAALLTGETLSPRELVAEPVTLTPAVEAEELVAA